jgi:hypothetical protein
VLTFYRPLTIRGGDGVDGSKFSPTIRFQDYLRGRRTPSPTPKSAQTTCSHLHTAADVGAVANTKSTDMLSHLSSVTSNTKVEDVAADDSTISHHDLALAKLEGRDS